VAFAGAGKSLPAGFFAAVKGAAMPQKSPDDSSICARVSKAA
jgi:hypothetical protein